MTTRSFARIAFIALIALAAPALVSAQAPWPSSTSPGFTEGLNRGVRAGEEDARRGQSYNFTDESDFRNADAGYRSQYGPRDRYRDEFRRGYESGYRSGYGRYSRVPSQGGLPPYYDGRVPDGRVPYDRRTYGDPRYGDPRYPYGGVDRRNDLALVTGYSDGYDRGLDDGHDRRRFDPVGESRYRSGDHGYERWYGPKDLYKARYREAFREGYEQGYQDGRRYSGQRPWWWPF